MKVHGNAALGPAGRLALAQAIESGMTQKAAAAAFCVAPATAHRWWHRWREASESERRSGSWLRDRPCTPHRQPRRLSAIEEEPILRARRETNLGPGRLAGICRRARSTIWKVARLFAAEVARVGARQIFTPPYTPRWNGKVERFFQTLKREWGYAHAWPNSGERTRALASFLRYYNRRRPHSSLGDRPPISRVHNVRG
jgi:transposase-like protein